MPRIKHLFIFFCIINACTFFGQKEITILDLTAKNAESTNGNLFSAEHILKSAGFSYSVTNQVNSAVKSKVVLFTSNIETTTFVQAERDTIAAFLGRGGVAIVTNMKDPLLDSYFGISATLFNTTRFSIKFKTNYNDTIFKLFDDDFEKKISLGSTTSYTSTIGTRAYTLTSGDTLATYETNEIAAFHNKYQKGHVYVLGTQLKDVILRPQVKQDFSAARAYSNSFEPGQDVYIFMVSGIIQRHLKHVIRKHTAPCNFKSALVITHDVDATTSIGMFDDYANYEKINNIVSTYLITTHYMHDKVAKNFFDDNLQDILKVFQLGHDIQSHSVSHVPDFDNEIIIPMGSPGNTKSNYQPYYDGTVSSNVTVFGEAEVSRDLLRDVTKKNITCFRPGYLAFHNNLINALDSLHYTFSSSHSSNDVLTNFPFMSHTDLSMSGRLTNVLEMPNHISDVFMADPITEENFLSKVDSWKTNFTKAYNNNISSLLLIHPTRYYKLYAQQLLIQFLPQDAVISNITEYGNYWLNRYAVDFSSVVSGDTLDVYLNKKQTELNTMLSFVITNGKDYHTIKVYDSDLTKVNYVKSAWQGNDVILHNDCPRPDYNRYQVTQSPVTSNVYIYPNPSDKTNGKLHFEIMNELTVSVSIYDMKGKYVCIPFSDKKYNLGVYDVDLSSCQLAAGMYVVKARIGEETFYVKWILE